MTRYWFENWQSGKMYQILFCQAISIEVAVSQLSDSYKGVFKLQSKQTEVERIKENWLEFERVLGD